jgi:hypothetical protein
MQPETADDRGIQKGLLYPAKEPENNLPQAFDDYDWSALFADEDQGGIAKMLPWVITILNIVVLFLLMKKK